MENFILGIEALFKLVKIELSLLVQSSVMKGFLAGYVVATLVYAFLETSRRHRDRVCGVQESNINNT